MVVVVAVIVVIEEVVVVVWLKRDLNDFVDFYYVS